MIIRKTELRNREIYAAYHNGEQTQDLANRYGLSVITIDEILRIERHKLAVSVDGFYEDLRSRI